MPSEMGPCHRYTKRYYYNVTFEKCRPFNYSGCEGNNNNFESFLYCQDSCSEASKVHSDQLGHKCQMPKDSGTFFSNISFFSLKTLHHNVWCIKFRSKDSSNTVVCLLRNLMHQTFITHYPFVETKVERHSR